MPAASAQVAAPARPAAQPVAPDPALLALRAEHPQLLNLDPARDRDGWFTMARLHAAGHVALIQPYLAAIERHGETALVFFAGEFSHAVRKAAILVPGLRMVEGLYAAEEIGPTTVSASELALAAAALAAVPGRRKLLYARVDLVPDDDGQPRVLELELAEPSVFLDHADGASDRFAAALAGV